VKQDYLEFLATKRSYIADAGFNYDPPEFLYDFQRIIVRRALRVGRFAIFADCGLGKTPMQLVWADAVSRRMQRPVLILTPLAVSEQTRREGNKFSMTPAPNDLAEIINHAEFLGIMSGKEVKSLTVVKPMMKNTYVHSNLM